MAMGPGNFTNIFKRLDVELDRMRRANVPSLLIDNFRNELLKYKPAEEPSPIGAGVITTPYQIAFNRLEGVKSGNYTYNYFIEAWEKCSPEDQLALNELWNEYLKSVGE